MGENVQIHVLNIEDIRKMDNDVRIYILGIEDIRNLSFDCFERSFPQRYERAMRYKFEADRLRCLGAGYLMNNVLGVVEDDVRIGENGKPYVDGGPEFNISHSGDYVVLAVVDAMADKSIPCVSIGVDIEKIDERNIEIADRVFTEDELDWMSGNPEERFWILWTLKEAASKAVGAGMTIDYKSFSVLPLTESKTIELNGATLQSYTKKIEGHYLSVVTTLSMYQNNPDSSL